MAQNGADQLSAVGVVQAGADHSDGALLCQSGGTPPDLAGYFQGYCAGGPADAAGADAAGSGDGADLYADFAGGAVSGGDSLEAGGDCRGVDEREGSQAVPEGQADQLHQSGQ